MTKLILTITTPVLQMRKLTNREVKSCSQGKAQKNTSFGGLFLMTQENNLARARKAKGPEYGRGAGHKLIAQLSL